MSFPVLTILKKLNGNNVNIMRKPAKVHNVVILVFDKAQMLDIAGPSDVFGMANSFNDDIRYKVTCVSKRGGPVLCTNGLHLDSRSILQFTRSKVDTLIVAGAEQKGLSAGSLDPEVEAWVTKVSLTAKRVASVCVGSFALAHWGLLTNRKATCHWAAVDRLQGLYPSVVVDRSAIFVQDDQIWTAGGVTTGIDLALAMVEKDTSRNVASQVAAMLVMSHRRSGNQAQHSVDLMAQSGRYSELVMWMRANLRTDLKAAALAEQANESERSFFRRFTAEMGRTPMQFVEDLRLNAAKLALQGGASVKAAAKLAGFTSQEHLSRTFRRRIEMTPQAYRELY